jgi:glucose uptake protein
MLTVESYSVAVAMCVVTMLCWGSWANTQKLATQEWRFQLFYWDYAFGVFLLALVLAFTLGSSGSAGRGFLADLMQAEGKWLGSAFLGGVIFNLANILLVAAIDVAGLAVAFPVGIGLALVLGVVTTYFAKPEGNVPMLALGVGCVMMAIVLDALAYKRLAADGFLLQFRRARDGQVRFRDSCPGSGQVESVHGHRAVQRRRAGVKLPLE